MSFLLKINMKTPITIFYTLLLLLSSLRAQSQATLTVNPTSLSGFTTAVGAPSAEQAVTVNGSGLTGNVTVTASSGFEVSWTVGANFGSSITLTQAGGLFTNVPLYVRLTGAVLGSVSGAATISSPGATSQTISLSGTVTAAPTPNPPCTTTSFSPTSGLGGNRLLVNFYGQGYIPGVKVQFLFGTRNYVATFVSANQVSVWVDLPSVSMRTLTYFSVGNPQPGGGGSGGMLFFTINPGPPTITTFSPTSGPVGTRVTITGTNLGIGPTTTSFNGTTTNVVGPPSPSDTNYTTQVPAGATTGLITVTNSNGAAVSAMPFTVTTAPPALFEDFEQGTKTSYVPASVQLQSGGWTLAEALIGTTPNADKFNGAKSARLRGGGFIEMDTDKPNGAGVVTVSAANYATETGTSFVPEISTDGGVTYTSLLGGSPAPTLTSTLTQYSFTANRTGNVRLRFSSTNTAAASNPRINLDDIGITDYRLGAAVQTGQALPNLQVSPNPAHDQLTISGSGAAQVVLYDLLGRLALAPRPLAAGQTLALPATLATGTYLLLVKNDAGQRVVRVVKE
jgi:hypothetical protein